MLVQLVEKLSNDETSSFVLLLEIYTCCIIEGFVGMLFRDWDHSYLWIISGGPRYISIVCAARKAVLFSPDKLSRFRVFSDKRSPRSANIHTYIKLTYTKTSTGNAGGNCDLSR